MTTKQIDVDQVVYEALKKMAEPFVDSPNSVLRRVLGLAPSEANGQSPTADKLKHKSVSGVNDVRSKHFVEKVLAREFGHGFARKGRYTYMLENRTHLIYFQNFNAAYDNAWFRIESPARKVLESSNRKAFLCLTVPVDDEYFLIPFDHVRKQIEQSRWARPELEINIDRIRSHWRELKWDIKNYRKHLDNHQIK